MSDGLIQCALADILRDTLAFTECLKLCPVFGGDYAVLPLYNEPNCYEPRLNWTLAHEVGHIYMGHKNDGAIEEIEAHWFAAELLIPNPILIEFLKRGKTVTNYSLMNLFGVSWEASCKKVSSFNRMPIKSAYLYDDFLEKYGAIIDTDTVEKMLG